MPYLIDGHNLIARLPDISLDDPHDEMKLVTKLIGFSNRVKKKCVVVFDKGLPSGKSPASRSMVEVYFASTQSNADAVLQGRIKSTKDTLGWTLVSNDQAIISTAQQVKMNVMRCEQFARLLATPQNEYDLGEWTHVNIPTSEVDEWLKVFRHHPAPEPPTVPAILPPQTKPKAPPIEAKTLPKPHPTRPKPPPAPKPPKRPKRIDNPRDDDKTANAGDVAYWLKMFGE